MGSNHSKPQSKPPTQKQLIERRGVLIPPVFAIARNNGSSGANATVSAYDRLPLTPSLVDYLASTQFGQGLLHDFMDPGMWVLAGGTDATGNATTTVRASLPQTSNGGKISFSSSPSAYSGSVVELRTGTEGPMHLFATHQLFQKGYLYANLNTAGGGYVGGKLGVTVDRGPKPTQVELDEPQFVDFDDEDEESASKIHFEVGSWVPLKAAKSNNTRSNSLQKSAGFLESPDHVHGYVSVDMLGSTTVLETKWNSNTLENEVSKYFSMRLNGGSTGAQSTDTDNTATLKSPPLWLTMTSTPQTSTINISQMLTFDRINFGIDQRAPSVRNTFGWCVQMEKPNRDGLHASQLSVAMAWQANRNLAFKAVGTSTQNDGQSNSHGLTCAMLFKRWKQPRVACSVLGRYNFPGFRFVGVGLELETDVLAGNNYAPTSAQVSDQQIPETKAALG